MEAGDILNMNKRTIFDIAFVIVIAALYRTFPHIPNVAPIAALALYSGANLDKRIAVILPLSIMLLSDVIIGFHGTMVFVYGSFLLATLIGFWLRKHQSFTHILAATVGSSLLFFVITNFGVWLEGRMYSPTVEGLIMCYYMALPFFRNTLVGDLGYAGLFFGLHVIVKNLSLYMKVSKVS